MNHQSIEHEKAFVLKLSGEIDFVSSQTLRELISSCVQKGKTRLLIDFSRGYLHQ